MILQWSNTTGICSSVPLSPLFFWRMARLDSTSSHLVVLGLGVVVTLRFRSRFDTCGVYSQLHIIPMHWHHTFTYSWGRMITGIRVTFRACHQRFSLWFARLSFWNGWWGVDMISSTPCFTQVIMFVAHFWKPKWHASRNWTSLMWSNSSQRITNQRQHNWCMIMIFCFHVVKILHVSSSFGLKREMGCWFGDVKCFLLCESRLGSERWNHLSTRAWLHFDVAFYSGLTDSLNVDWVTDSIYCWMWNGLGYIPVKGCKAMQSTELILWMQETTLYWVKGLGSATKCNMGIIPGSGRSGKTKIQGENLVLFTKQLKMLANTVEYPYAV